MIDKAVVDELVEAYWTFRERFPPYDITNDERSHRTALSMTANYARLRAEKAEPYSPPMKCAPPLPDPPRSAMGVQRD